MLRRLYRPGDVLSYFSSICIPALLGFVLIFIVMRTDLSASYFPIASVLSLIGLFFAVLLQGMTVSGRLDLALSFGAKRKNLFLSFLLGSFLICLCGVIFAYAIYRFELFLYPILFADRAADGEMILLQDLIGTIPMALLLLLFALATWLVQVISLGFIISIGQKFFVFWPLFYLACMLIRGVFRRMAYLNQMQFLQEVSPIVWGVLVLLACIGGFMYTVRQFMRHSVRL